MSLPKLQDLTIDFTTKFEERDTNMVQNSLSKLRTLNGISVQDIRNKKRGVSNIVRSNSEDTTKYILRKDDIEEFKIQIECINVLYKEKEDSRAREIEEEFNTSLKKNLSDQATLVKPDMSIQSIQNLTAVGS